MHQNCCYLRIISLVILICRVNLIIINDIHSLMELVFCNVLTVVDVKYQAFLPLPDAFG